MGSLEAEGLSKIKIRDSSEIINVKPFYKDEINDYNIDNELSVPKKARLEKDKINDYIDEKTLIMLKKMRIEKAQSIIENKKRDSIVNFKARKRFADLFEKIERKEEMKDPIESDSFRSIVFHKRYQTDREKSDLANRFS
jgi:hypothetical protein